MIIFNNAESISLINFLVHQLIRDDVPFHFVDAHDVRWRSELKWVQNDDPVALVDSIVDEAIAKDACLIISAVSPKTDWTQSNAFFVGFVPSNSN